MCQKKAPDTPGQNSCFLKVAQSVIVSMSWFPVHFSDFTFDWAVIKDNTETEKNDRDEVIKHSIHHQARANVRENVNIKKKINM